MRKARYLVLEGCEGVGKTTQVELLTRYLQSKNFSVLQTKEPGTPLSPLTMQLRAIMLDKQYDGELTIPARELISQAIRSIHLNSVIIPALDKYDFIVQDRGMLSGLAYGTACGNSLVSAALWRPRLCAPCSGRRPARGARRSPRRCSRRRSWPRWASG